MKWYYIYIRDIINNLKYKQLNSVNAWIQIFQIKKNPNRKGQGKTLNSAKDLLKHFLWPWHLI